MDIEKIVREEARALLVGWIYEGKSTKYVTALVGDNTVKEIERSAVAPKKNAVRKRPAKAKLVHRQPTNAETNVLAALANGHETAGAIAAYTEGVLNARQAGQTLKRLVDQGLVTKQGERRFTTYHAVAQNGAAT